MFIDSLFAKGCEAIIMF
jgi:hypothetical protein